jgi:hypothetical protein
MRRTFEATPIISSFDYLLAEPIGSAWIAEWRAFARGEPSDLCFSIGWS